MVKLTFYLVKSTFDMVNFLLLISVREKHRLQTGSEVQTECKMQTEDCRPDQGQNADSVLKQPTSSEKLQEIAGIEAGDNCHGD